MVMNWDWLSCSSSLCCWLLISLQRLTHVNTEYVTALRWLMFIPHADPSGFSEQTSVMDSLLTQCKSSQQLLCLCAEWDSQGSCESMYWYKAGPLGERETLKARLKARSEGQLDAMTLRSEVIAQWSQVIGLSSRNVDRFMLFHHQDLSSCYSALDSLENVFPK